MIKQLASKDIKSYLMAEPNSVLLDVRTKEEWDTIGKPNGEKIGLKTIFYQYNLVMREFSMKILYRNLKI